MFTEYILRFKSINTLRTLLCGLLVGNFQVSHYGGTSLFHACTYYYAWVDKPRVQSDSGSCSYHLLLHKQLCSTRNFVNLRFQYSDSSRWFTKFPDLSFFNDRSALILVIPLNSYFPVTNSRRSVNNLTDHFIIYVESTNPMRTRQIRACNPKCTDYPLLNKSKLCFLPKHLSDSLERGSSPRTPEDESREIRHYEAERHFF